MCTLRESLGYFGKTEMYALLFIIIIIIVIIIIIIIELTHIKLYWKLLLKSNYNQQP